MRRCLVVLVLSSVAAFGQVEIGMEWMQKLFGFLSGGATEMTQLTNKAALLEQVQYDVKKYADMVKHGVKIGPLDLVNLSEHIWTLENAVRYGTAISSRLANEDKVFRGVFPGYGRVRGDYSVQYKDWTDRVIDTLTGGVRQGADVHRNILTGIHVIEELRKKAANADSRLAAIQVTAAASGEIAGQLLELRDLMQTDQDGRRAVMALDVQTKAHTVAQSAWFWSFERVPDKGNEGHNIK